MKHIEKTLLELILYRRLESYLDWLESERVVVSDGTILDLCYKSQSGNGCYRRGTVCWKPETLACVLCQV